MGMLLFNICAAFSEMVRELIRERVKAGLDSAKQKGRKGGRPKALTAEKAETVRALRQAGVMSVKQICETIKITLMNVCLLLMINLKMNLNFPTENQDVQHLIWLMLHVEDLMVFFRIT